MTLYLVKIPVTGTIEFEVHADSPEEAIERAVQEYTIDDLANWEGDDSAATVEENG